MTLTENILASLRKLWGKPDATPAELDQHAAELLAQDTPPEEEAGEADGSDTPKETEQPTDSPDAAELSALRAVVDQQAATISALEGRLREATDTIAALSSRLAALEELAPEATRYEEQRQEAAQNERYLCETTRRAMRLNGR